MHMKVRTYYAGGISLGGLSMVAVGIMHIFLPTFGYSPEVVARLGPALADHFYYLATYALCAFFLTQGAFSLWLAGRPPFLAGLMAAAALALWWWWRLILEVLYPVKVTLFGVEDPTRILIPAIMLAAAGYTLALVSGAYALKRHKTGDAR
jgi:hypothetical protein